MASQDYDFKSLLKIDSKEEKIQHDAEIIMFQFLSEIEKIMETQDLSRKALAEMAGVSPSFVTQLFRGHKLLNLKTLAKFQEALNICFKINASKSSSYGNNFSLDELRALLKDQQGLRETPLKKFPMPAYKDKGGVFNMEGEQIAA